MSQLLSPAAMAAIRRVGELGMITDVEIFSESYDTGTDLADNPYGSSTDFPTTASVTVKGWLVGLWATRRERAVGDIDSTTNYRLRLPVGTVIKGGDRVDISGNSYYVMDAGTDQTWPEWLACTLRRNK